jgi:hypothetical protein
MDKNHTAHLIDNRHARKDYAYVIGGGTALTSFRNIVNMKTPISVARKAQQFPRISTHLMMAE